MEEKRRDVFCRNFTKGMHTCMTRHARLTAQDIFFGLYLSGVVVWTI